MRALVSQFFVRYLVVCFAVGAGGVVLVMLLAGRPVYAPKPETIVERCEREADTVAAYWRERGRAGVLEVPRNELVDRCLHGALGR